MVHDSMLLTGCPGDTDWQQRDDQRDQREIHMEVAHLRAKKASGRVQMRNAALRDHEFQALKLKYVLK
jgi:hypothetical protein